MATRCKAVRVNNFICTWLSKYTGPTNEATIPIVTKKLLGHKYLAGIIAGAKKLYPHVIKPRMRAQRLVDKRYIYINIYMYVYRYDQPKGW